MKLSKKVYVNKCYFIQRKHDKNIKQDQMKESEKPRHNLERERVASFINHSNF